MRKKRFLVGTVVVIAAIVLVYVILKRFSADEEAPIIVKNGSMDVVAGDDPGHNKHWKWTNPSSGGNPEFFHEAKYPHSNKNPGPLLVYVIGSPTGGCTKLTSGDTVTATFSDGFSIKFSRVQHGASNNYYTHAQASSPDLTEVSGSIIPTLRHAGSGFVESVAVGSAAPCTFANAAALTFICIGPDDPTAACEQ